MLQVGVVHLPVLDEAFTTAPLTGTLWVFCVAIASTVLWVSEIRKLVLRLVDRHSLHQALPRERAA